MSNPVLTQGFKQTSPIVDENRMSGSGVTRSSLTLLALFAPAAVWGWTQVPSAGVFPTWTIGAIIVGLVAVIAATFRPQWSPFLGPVYAIAEGVFVGAISAAYASMYEGIVTNAILGTFLTVIVMAVLYATRTIRVTQRLRSIVIGATVGIFVFYVASFALSFFGVNMPFVWDSGPIGILFSVGVIILAAFNLLLDFDLIERGVRGGAPGYMNWYAALGLLVTIVWLYLEILRLLAKLQRD